MASQTSPPPTNERILHLLEELKAQLAESRTRDEQIARDLTRLLEHR